MWIRKAWRVWVFVPALCAFGQAPILEINADKASVRLDFASQTNHHYLVEKAATISGPWNAAASMVATNSLTHCVLASEASAMFRVRDLRAELETARSLWSKSGIQTYDLWSTRRGQLAGPVSGQRVRASVVSNAVETAFIPFPAQGSSYFIAPGDYNRVWRIDQWFAFIDAALQDPSGAIELQWDGTGAYPTRFRYHPANLDAPLFDMSVELIDIEHKLLACRLAEAKARWAAAQVTNYQASFRQLCFCTFPEETARVNYTVNAGQILDATFDPSGNPVSPQFVPNYTTTVEALFDRIEALMTTESTLDVSFSPLGPPTRMFYNLRDEIIYNPPAPPIFTETVDDELLLLLEVRPQE